MIDGGRGSGHAVALVGERYAVHAVGQVGNGRTRAATGVAIVVCPLVSETSRSKCGVFHWQQIDAAVGAVVAAYVVGD